MTMNMLIIHEIRYLSIFLRAVDGRKNTKRRGYHRINLLPTTSHVYFGSVTGAILTEDEPGSRFRKEYHRFRALIERVPRLS